MCVLKHLIDYHLVNILYKKNIIFKRIESLLGKFIIFANNFIVFVEFQLKIFCLASYQLSPLEYYNFF